MITGAPDSTLTTESIILTAYAVHGLSVLDYLMF
jgi:hypothetical protein